MHHFELLLKAGAVFHFILNYFGLCFLVDIYVLKGLFYLHIFVAQWSFVWVSCIQVNENCRSYRRPYIFELLGVLRQKNKERIVSNKKWIWHVNRRQHDQDAKLPQNTNQKIKYDAPNITEKGVKNNWTTFSWKIVLSETFYKFPPTLVAAVHSMDVKWFFVRKRLIFSLQLQRSLVVLIFLLFFILL